MNLDLLTRPLIEVTADETDLFRRVLGTVVVVPQNQDHRWLTGTLKAIRQEIKVVQRYASSGRHFKVEGVQESSSQKLVELRRAEKHFEMALAGYPQVIDPSFVSWRRPDGLPSFIVLSLDSQDFSLSVTPDESGDTFSTRPYLHPQLAVQYLPVADYLLDMARKGRQAISISAHFSGNIPLSTNLKVKRAEKSRLFKPGGLVLVSEAPEVWEVRKTAIIQPVPADPLIIGCVVVGKGIPDQFYLIDKFNLTTLEEAALRSHALDPFYPG